ncbi:hypothetical protein [Burkholderia diffusa]|uniref:hypothetical protein n=1 Tax=Burkholderia diffusa TaxID=488732 RepID=UPI00158431C5|nr:hypothetical protein [Burkholderia diffusa]
MGGNFSEQVDDHTQKHGSYGLKLVSTAAKLAANFAQSDGLHPVVDDNGELRYRIQQGLRAACVGREDAAATLILMQTVLDNQRAIKRLLWAGLGVLLWIAYRLS